MMVEQLEYAPDANPPEFQDINEGPYPQGDEVCLPPVLFA